MIRRREFTLEELEALLEELKEEERLFNVSLGREIEAVMESIEILKNA